LLPSQRPSHLPPNIYRPSRLDSTTICGPRFPRTACVHCTVLAPTTTSEPARLTTAGAALSAAHRTPQTHATAAECDASGPALPSFALQVRFRARQTRPAAAASRAVRKSNSPTPCSSLATRLATRSILASLYADRLLRLHWLWASHTVARPRLLASVAPVPVLSSANCCSPRLLLLSPSAPPALS
jgi:hypothetical protein